MDDAKQENICRACLTEEGEFQSVFVADERTGLTIHLAEMIMAYASVQITFGDGLPEQICVECAKKVTDSFLFKQQCEKSDTKLRERFGRSPLPPPEEEAQEVEYAGIKEEELLLMPMDKKSMGQTITIAEDEETMNIIIKPEISMNGDSECDYILENDSHTEEGASDKEEEVKEVQIVIQQEEDVIPGKNPLESDNKESVKKYMPAAYKYKHNMSERECDICLKTFSRPSHLNRHRKVHLNGKMYFCEICNKGFTRNDVRLRHQIIHNMDSMEIEKLDGDSSSSSEEEPEFGMDMGMDDFLLKHMGTGIRCHICDKRFYKKETLNLHMKQLHDLEMETAAPQIKEEQKTTCDDGGGGGGGVEGEDGSASTDPHACNVCGKTFKKANRLTRHCKIHAAVKPNVCELCNKSFVRAEQLMNHMNVHTGVKPHVCTICEKGFNQISNLKDHMRTHNGEKPFLCSICGKGFNQLGNLRQHTIRHSGIKAHLCSICGNGFASKGELGAHLRKHTGARPFVCQVCNHGFTTSSSLTKHKRIHSGEKPYECEVCKMKFSRSGILARHKRTHTGEKPYVCKFCGKAFSQSNDLSSHLRIHTGEKPYICDCCGNAFRQSSALKTHKKTHLDKGSSMEPRNRSLPVTIIHHNLI